MNHVKKENVPVKTMTNRLLGVEIGENDCLKNNLIQILYIME